MNRKKISRPLFNQLGFVLIFCLVSITAMSQVKLSGKVTGSDGKGIPSISVVVSNTSFGGATDGDGNYNFTADLKPGTYTLQFSGVGFKTKSQTLTVGSESAYTSDISLEEDALKLDEVVVTGVSAGTTRKQLGSYIGTVKGDDLTKGATSNVLGALQGKTAGAQIVQNNGDPGGGFSVRLRGISSISSSSEPLYIVDGVIVNNATTRMSNLINSLLEFSKLSHSKKLTTVDCNQLIADVIEDLDMIIKDSNAIIEVGKLPQLNLYEIEIRQLFQNLILNGIKFQVNGNRPEIQIHSTIINNKFMFSVSDNGIGIDPAYFDRIFNIFQRLESNNKYEGSGIGLANCKKIVQLHHGDIWVESIRGKGSTFYFTIPNLTV